jgi:heme-degrading monooxygenase HmoA
MKDEPVVLINAFEVPAGEDDLLVRGWERARDFLRTQVGYVSSQLQRSITPAADFRFVNVAVWESAEAFRLATGKPEFNTASVPYQIHASLYHVVKTDDPVNTKAPERGGKQTATGEQS